MLRQGFANSLQKLRDDLADMAGLVDAALAEALAALAAHSPQRAWPVIERGDVIDERQTAIEDKCLALIALQQPLAADLRALSTALKIAVDLEHMGNQVENIAQATLEIGREPFVAPLVHIPDMAARVRHMLKDALAAYLAMDAELAEQVWRAGDEVDDMCDNTLRELLNCMVADHYVIGQASQLSHIARCLERAGGYAGSIAKNVIFFVTGQRIK